MGTTYDVRVVVTDPAGNIAEKPGRGTTLNNRAPVFSGTPTVARVSNSNTKLTITAQATDADGDSLTYTLYVVNGSTVTKATDVQPQTKTSGQSVTFTKGSLGNYSSNSFIVKVTDGKISEEVASNQCSGTTYCLGSYCSGGSRTWQDCFSCGGSGAGTTKCSGTFKSTVGTSVSCSTCGQPMKKLTIRCNTCSFVSFNASYCANSSCSRYSNYSEDNSSKCRQPISVQGGCSSCSGTKGSYVTTNCSAHNKSSAHYYCSTHGNSVNQYHG